MAMHIHCAGLDNVPRGKWLCPKHAPGSKKKSRLGPEGGAPAKNTTSANASNAARNAAKADQTGHHTLDVSAGTHERGTANGIHSKDSGASKSADMVQSSVDKQKQRMAAIERERMRLLQKEKGSKTKEHKAKKPRTD